MNFNKVTYCLIFFALGSILLEGCVNDEQTTPSGFEDNAESDLVEAWIEIQLPLIQYTPGFQAPIVARAIGYTGLTLYESLVPGLTKYNSISNEIQEFPILTYDEDLEFNWFLVANSSMLEVCKSLYSDAPSRLYPSGIETLFDSLNNVYGRNQEVDSRSIALGEVWGKSIAEWATTDGGAGAQSNNFPVYDPPEGPEKWVPVEFGQALLPFWSQNRTFIPGIVGSTQPDGHPEFSIEENSEFYLEALEVYQTVNSLSEEEREIAFFWTDDPLSTYTPPGHFLSILLQILQNDKIDLGRAVEAYCKLGISQNDAFISCWETKYGFNLLRPSTYIQRHIDQFWSSEIINPPFPEYSSGHSTQSAAAAKVLASVFGENYKFTDSTHLDLDLGLGSRSYSSFYEAAEEAGLSRIYGGIHYQFGNLDGRKQGYEVADFVIDLPFKRQ